MSDPSADARRAPSGAALLGIALGLIVLVGIAVSLLIGGIGTPADGRAKMMQAFGAAELPFGLQMQSSTVMSNDTTLVVYTMPGAAPEEASATATPTPADEKQAEIPGETAAPPPVDWSTLPIPDVSGPPRQVAFLFVPANNGRAVLDQMIRNVFGSDRGQLGSEGGTVLMERGRLDYRGWDSDWIHLRTYERGGTFRDAMRISLSTREDPCVSTVTWPRGVPASLALLEQVVRPLVSARVDAEQVSPAALETPR